MRLAWASSPSSCDPSISERVSRERKEQWPAGNPGPRPGLCLGSVTPRGLKGSAPPGDLPGREPGAGTEPRRVQPCLGSLLFAQAYHHHLTPAAHKQSAREQLTQGWTGEAMHSSLGWQHSSGHDLLGRHRRGCCWQVAVAGLGHGRLHPGVELELITFQLSSLAHVELS